jgi:hypothetical protein
MCSLQRSKYVILNWQRPLWEGDHEIAKKSGRDEPMWVAVYMCMEAILGISLYSYLYLKLAKTLCLSNYLLCFLFYRVQEVGTGFAWKQGSRREVAQTMYTHVSKCKNYKI